MTSSLLVPHFETLFELISTRLYTAEAPQSAGTAPTVRSKRSGGIRGDNVMIGWPHMCDLDAAHQIPALCVRLLASFVAGLIRQHTRSAQGSHDPVEIDVDVVSSVRSLVVGFFLTRLETTRNGGVEEARVRYALVKGLVTSLPDASPADLTTHLLPLFLACQDAEHRLRFKTVMLLTRLIRNRRLSDAFLPLLFFAGAHEPHPLIRATLRALLSEVARIWNRVCDEDGGKEENAAVRMAGTVRIEDLLPVLIVYTVQHPDYHDLSASHDTRMLVKG